MSPTHLTHARTQQIVSQEDDTRNNMFGEKGERTLLNISKYKPGPKNIIKNVIRSFQICSKVFLLHIQNFVKSGIFVVAFENGVAIKRNTRGSEKRFER